MLRPRKGSLMKTQTRILDNRLYYTRKIELHRKGEKSRTVRITPILICGVCFSPHLMGKCGTRPYFWWVRVQGQSPHAPSILRNANAPSAFPLLRRLRRRAMNPPPKGINAWVGGPLRPKEVTRYRDTLSQIRTADNTADRSANPANGEVQIDIDLRYLMTAPPNGHVWHKAFFRWVRAQGRSPHAPGIPKNAYGPVSIYLIRVPQALIPFFHIVSSPFTRSKKIAVRWSFLINATLVVLSRFLCSVVFLLLRNPHWRWKIRSLNSKYQINISFSILTIILHKQLTK